MKQKQRTIIREIVKLKQKEDLVVCACVCVCVHEYSPKEVYVKDSIEPSYFRTQLKYKTGGITIYMWYMVNSYAED